MLVISRQQPNRDRKKYAIKQWPWKITWQPGAYYVVEVTRIGKINFNTRSRTHGMFEFSIILNDISVKSIDDKFDHDRDTIRYLELSTSV